ncbi:MAG: HPr(Ser) kinase/phosphatase [Chlamydiales bacterium]
MYLVKDLYQECGETLKLKLIHGRKGLNRKIYLPEVQNPGLSLVGYLEEDIKKRILVFGKVEFDYLNHLGSFVRISRLKNLLIDKTPALIISSDYPPMKDLYRLCDAQQIPLFQTPLSTVELITKLTFLLTDRFMPSISCHGSFMEIFGFGVLIQGDPSIGKSDAALDLIERGHCLIADDLVKIRLREEKLEGYGLEPSRHHMEIRGIGIINIAQLYGAISIKEKKELDLIIKLEIWNQEHMYDRVGIEENTVTILGMKVVYHLLPVTPRRNIPLLIEAIILNHRLKKMGYHSGKEYNAKLISMIFQKEKVSV